MAMITCPECGKRISEYATMCIGCGIPMEIIKKLLTETEPETKYSTASISSTDKSIKKKILSCNNCGSKYVAVGWHCPLCGFPALSLSPNYEKDTIRDTKSPKTSDSSDMPFLMPIEDRFEISGRGTVVTGIVERGTLKTAEAVEIVGLRKSKIRAIVTGIEQYKKIINQAQTGQAVGVLLRGIRENDIVRGQVLAAPGTIDAHIRFKAQIYIYTKNEGGRYTPFFNGYRPQFYFRTTDVTGIISLPEGKDMCMPGTSEVMEINLIAPIAMEEGLHFVIREEGQTIGKGKVTSIIE